MNTIRFLFQLIFILGVTTAINSCKGQSKPETITNADIRKSIGKVVHGLPENIPVIYQDKKSNYWFGGKSVFKYDGKTLIEYSKEDGLPSDRVIGIQEDEDGNIYFDTDEAVSKFNGESFTTLEVIGSDSAENEWKLEPNDLWFRIGWNTKGPYRYDGTYLYQLEFPKPKHADVFYAKYPNVSFSPYGIYSLYKDDKGNIWFGTAALGVCRYDGENVSWLYEEQMTTTPGGGALGIRSTVEDKDGIYWFTNTRYSYEILPETNLQNGVHYLNYIKHDGSGYTDEKEETEFPYFMSITKDNDGNLWIGGDSGVWKIKGKELIHYPVKDGNKGVSVFSLYTDNNGTVWLGTNNAGVYKYNGKSFEKFKL